MTTYNHCVYRKSFKAGNERCNAADYGIEAFCVPVSDEEIEQGYCYRWKLKAGSNVVYPSEFGLRAFRINITEEEKARFKAAEEKEAA